jgi:hypothetical protein
MQRHRLIFVPHRMEIPKPPVKRPLIQCRTMVGSVSPQCSGSATLRGRTVPSFFLRVENDGRRSQLDLRTAISRRPRDSRGGGRDADDSARIAKP